MTLPPISPFCFVQEQELRSCGEPDNKWRMLVACCLLNKTSFKQVRPILRELFERYPTPGDFSAARAADVAQIISRCGLQNRRANRLVSLAEFCAKPGWEAAYQAAPGTGKYAWDSWRLFVDGRVDVSPTDKKLVQYLEWRKSPLQETHSEIQKEDDQKLPQILPDGENDVDR